MDIHSIRTRIAAITVAAILVTVAAVFGASYPNIKEENDHRTLEMMDLMASDTGKSIEEYLESIEQSVESVANLADDTLDSTVLISNGAAGDFRSPEERTAAQNEAIDAYLKDYCDRIQVVFGSIAARSYGVVTYYYCIDPGISRNEHGFFYSKIGKTGFIEKEPLDAGGLDPEDTMHNAWYFTPVERGRPSWVGPYRSDYLGDIWICSYIIPIYKAGQLIGVMGLDIPVDTFISQLEDIKVYDTGFACLLDQQGRVIYHPEYEIGEVLEQNGRAFSEELLSQDSNGDELIRYSMNGVERQMAFVTLSSGMKLLVTAPVREINASQRHLAGMVAIIAFAVMVLFALVILLIMRHITRPLKDLTDASQRLAGGDYDVELEYRGRDEIGMLTGAFIQMRDRIRQYIDDLNRRINTDALTGLPNMRCFFGLAETERKRLRDEGRDSVMLYFNLTGVKHYNRQYGFEEGDRLLCEFADILSRCFGEGCVCHMSDDHFAAVADEDGIEEKLKAVVDECSRANGGITLPVNIGIYPDRLEEVGVSVACDRAKYICDLHKGEYESGWYTFEGGSIAEIENQRYIIGHLDQAIREQWIKVYYQPIISAKSGKVCDVEALSRWDDPEIGFMSPAFFIPVLETARLIYKLDLYVLERILEKIKMQMEEGITIVPHSINLSRSDFESCDIVEEIRRRVDDSGISRDRFTIEVTESMVGSDFEFMKSQIQRFQKLGFRVWMDDFGSGYSALDVLSDIRFDLLKFDMQFMRRFDEGDESRIILSQLIRMAEELGIDTLCEGVETEAQAEFLREAGCSKMQGYLFGRPIPYEEIVRRYRDGTHLGYDDTSE